MIRTVCSDHLDITREMTVAETHYRVAVVFKKIYIISLTLPVTVFISFYPTLSRLSALYLLLRLSHAPSLQLALSLSLSTSIFPCLYHYRVSSSLPFFSSFTSHLYFSSLIISLTHLRVLSSAHLPVFFSFPLPRVSSLIVPYYFHSFTHSLSSLSSYSSPFVHSLYICSLYSSHF